MIPDDTRINPQPEPLAPLGPGTAAGDTPWDTLVPQAPSAQGLLEPKPDKPTPAAALSSTEVAPAPEIVPEQKAPAPQPGQPDLRPNLHVETPGDEKEDEPRPVLSTRVFPQPEAPAAFLQAPEPPRSPAADTAPGTTTQTGPWRPGTTPGAGGGQPDLEQQRREYWDSVLTGNPYTVPETVCAAAGCDDLSMDLEERNYFLAQAINRSWLADTRNYPQEYLVNNWTACRAELAQELDVEDDEMEVFCGLSVMQSDLARREAARDIIKRSYRDGLMGRDYENDVEKLELVHPEDRAALDALGMRCYQAGTDLRERWRPLAERVANGMEVFAGMEEEAILSPRAFAGLPDLVYTVDCLCDLNEEDRNLVICLAADMARQRRKTAGAADPVPSRMIRAANRGIANTALNFTTISDYMGIAAVETAANWVGGDLGRDMRRQADKWDQRSRMAYHLRQISQQEISPLYLPEDADKLASYAIDAAEGTPTAVLAFCGPAGFTGIAGSGMGASIAEARARAPMSDRDIQLRAAISAGLAQAGIYMGMTRVGGKMLENSISTFLKSRGAGAAAFTMNGLKASGAVSLHGAELMAAGKLSQAVDLGSQEIASRLTNTASNIDWKQYGDNLSDIQANLHEGATLLPYLLIGSGRATLRHFRAPQTLLGDGSVLKEWGISEETGDKILKEKNIDTQNKLLKDALQESTRWSAPEFLPDIMRAMGLLNSDYFRGFQQQEAVRDFLNMPAEVSHVEKPEPVVRTVEEMEGLTEHVADRRSGHFTRSARYAAAMQLWDSWWQKSHIAEFTGPYFRALLEGKPYNNPRSDRSAAYQIILGEPDSPIPARMHNTGADAPRSEAERRALLRDTVQEIQDLSYQFIMGVFPLDAIIKKAYSVERTANDAERTRLSIVGQVGRSVLSMALGTPPHIELRELQTYISRYLINRRHRERGIRPEWLVALQDKALRTLPDRLAEFDHYDIGGHYELREMMRVMGGLSACAYRLVNLLPMCSDFGTALARGMTPAQAFHHLTMRELGYDPAKVVNYPMREIEISANTSNMQLFGEEARHCFSIFRDLTGTRLEQTAGADGATYWRVRKPDGTYTRWHGSEQAATDDLAISVAPFFSPMGDKYFRWLRFFTPRRGFDISARPTADYKEFCGFDQLAGIAARELKAVFFQDASRAMPGFLFKPLRKVLRGHRKLDSTAIRTQKDDSYEPGGEVVVDSLSALTPYQLVNARLRTFWKRMLDSGFIPAEKVQDFLQGRGRLTAERRAKQEEQIRVLPYPKNPNTPLNQTPPPDIGGRNRDLAEIMGEYHTLHYFAHLPEHHLPPSVLRWFNMAPFCPPLPPEKSVSPVAPRVSLRIAYGPYGRTALAWSNRMTAMKLHGLAPELERIRTESATSPLPPEIAELFPLADGESPAQRYEQSWCFRQGGEGVFHSTPQSLWNLLLSPRRGWECMPGAERDDLRARVHHTALTDPATSALDAEGRGESVDHVQEAIFNLDDALHRHPDLHRYAPVDGTSTRVRVLELRDPVLEDPSVDSPEQEPIKLDMEHYIHGDNISYREIPTPEHLLEDPEAMQALRFLHVLRSTTLQRPYVVNHTIWYNHEAYGGLLGRRPEGMVTWELYDPLANLFRLYNNIHTLQESGGPVDVCDVPVPGEEWRPTDFNDLRAVTVLRWPQNRSRVSRMMPGFPEASDNLVRTPYLVLANSGVYTGNHRRMIHDSADLHNSYLALESYTRKFFHNTTGEDGDPTHAQQLGQWRRDTVEHTLRALSAWPEHWQELLDNPQSGVHGLSELLLRLCEDTGFTYELQPDEPLAISREEAHVANISHAILRCMQEDNSPEARRALAEAMRPLETDPELREAVVDLLTGCNDLIERGSRKPPKKELEKRRKIRDILRQQFFPFVEDGTDGAPPPDSDPE